MQGTRTLTIIKPDAVEKNCAGAILKMIEDTGFRIVAMKKMWLSEHQAGQFYSIHRDRPFFADLVKFMTSGPVIPAILEKENAVEDFRKLIGATNPDNAAEGTVRKLFADSIERNAIHGSDSDENAIVESNFFFARTERF